MTDGPDPNRKVLNSSKYSSREGDSVPGRHNRDYFRPIPTWMSAVLAVAVLVLLYFLLG